jgi:hypothetical protein
MNRFRGVIYPYSTIAGKLANLTTDPSHPEPVIEEGLWVLRDWVQWSVYTLDVNQLNQVLELFLFASGEIQRIHSRVYVVLIYIALAIDHYRAFRYIQDARLHVNMSDKGYRTDSLSRTRTPLFLDLANCLFADSVENGIGFIQ